MNKFITSGKIIVVLGPNASGKSEFAVKVAKKFNGEIISADSRQVYRGLDIGSGKVEGKWKKISNFQHGYRTGRFLIFKQILNPKSQTNSKTKIANLKQKKYFVYKGIVHHCIDFVSPKLIFTAYDFKKYGERALADIFSRSKVAVICGGTGFYIDALLSNNNLAEIPPDFKLRKKLEQKSEEELFLELQKLNLEKAEKIDKNNKRRLIRALEIEFLKLKYFRKMDNLLGGCAAKFDVLYFGIKHPPEILKQRIEKRLLKRLKKGMIKEIENLHNKHKLSWGRLYDLGLEYRFVSLFLRQKEEIQKSRKPNLKEKSFNIKGIISHGKTMNPYFAVKPRGIKPFVSMALGRNENKFSFHSSLIEIKKAYDYFMLKIKIESWHYAKRQITWFKRNKEINWIDLSPEKLKMTEKIIKKFLTGN